jgi:hypothetical protein
MRVLAFGSVFGSRIVMTPFSWFAALWLDPPRPAADVADEPAHAELHRILLGLSRASVGRMSGANA